MSSHREALKQQSSQDLNDVPDIVSTVNNLELRWYRSVTTETVEIQNYGASEVLPGRHAVTLARILSDALDAGSTYVARWAVERGAE